MRRAFTLLELMMVLAILVVLAALAVPTMWSMEGHFKVTEAADILKARYADARSAAIDGVRPYRFGVLEGKSNYRIAPDSDNFWAGNSTTDEFGGEVVIIEGSLPDGIVFTEGNNPAALPNEGVSTIAELGSVAPAQFKTLAVFLADGTADQDVRVTLQCRDAAPIIVYLRGLTGAVTTRKGYEAEEEP